MAGTSQRSVYQRLERNILNQLPAGYIIEKTQRGNTVEFILKIWDFQLQEFRDQGSYASIEQAQQNCPDQYIDIPTSEDAENQAPQESE